MFNVDNVCVNYLTIIVFIALYITDVNVRQYNKSASHSN